MIVGLLLDQNKGIQSALDEITQNIQSKNDRIDALESKVVELQEAISTLKAGGDINPGLPLSNQISNNSCDTFVEVQERSIRSKNLMIFNIVENTSSDTKVRVNYDKTHVDGLLTKLEAQEFGEFKVVRVGKSGERPRPIKVIFSDSRAVSHCLKMKYKIRESDVMIKPDLTVMQRRHIKSLYEELDRRKNAGENNIGVRYRNGNPYIAKMYNPNIQSKNTH